MRIFVLALLILTNCQICAEQVKVAVIGDSITFGSGAQPRESKRYASRLASLLGQPYDVRVFAASSLCMLRKADKPYVKTKHFRDALAFEADIAVVTLGTNDTCQNAKRKNWDHHGDLREDALYLIGQLRKANPSVIVHLCSPPPMFPNQPGLKPARKKDLTERSKRLPLINRAYSQVAADLEDVYYHDMSRGLRRNETTDGVHPHTVGHARLGHRYFSIVANPATSK